MSELSGLRRIKKSNTKEQRAFSRRDTVVMSREELDVLLSIETAIARRDNERVTLVPEALSDVG